MGKAAKKANQAKHVEQGPKLLEEATLCIAKGFGSDAQCVEASAVLVATARALRYEVSARAVSIAGYSHDHPTSFYSSPRGEAWIRSVAATSGVALPPTTRATGSGAPTGTDFDRAGHMVVTMADPAMLFDPTLQQFTFGGLAPQPLVAQLPEANPESGFWHLSDDSGGYTIRYFTEDDVVDWRDDFETLVYEWQWTAHDLAAKLRAGARASDLGEAGFLLPPA